MIVKKWLVGCLAVLLAAGSFSFPAMGAGVDASTLEISGEDENPGPPNPRLSEYDVEEETIRFMWDQYQYPSGGHGDSTQNKEYTVFVNKFDDDTGEHIKGEYQDGNDYREEKIQYARRSLDISTIEPGFKYSFCVRAKWNGNSYSTYSCESITPFTNLSYELENGAVKLEWEDQFVDLIDDVEYKIMRNGKEIGKVDEPYYLDDTPHTSDANYKVHAIYNGEEIDRTLDLTVLANVPAKFKDWLTGSFVEDTEGSAPEEFGGYAEKITLTMFELPMMWHTPQSNNYSNTTKSTFSVWLKADEEQELTFKLTPRTWYEDMKEETVTVTTEWQEFEVSHQSDDFVIGATVALFSTLGEPVYAWGPLLVFE